MRRAGIIALAFIVVTTVFVITAGADGAERRRESRSTLVGGHRRSLTEPYGVAAAVHESARGARIAELEHLRDTIVVDLTLIRDELARQAAAAHPVATSSRPSSVGSGPGCPGAWAIPGDIVWREARCDRGAYNATGCVTRTGTGCFGPYQISHEHYEPGGRCVGLDPWAPAQQDACAGELIEVAGLSPWSTG